MIMITVNSDAPSPRIVNTRQSCNFSILHAWLTFFHSNHTHHSSTSTRIPEIEHHHDDLHHRVQKTKAQASWSSEKQDKTTRGLRSYNVFSGIHKWCEYIIP